jgi:hypothetical protein
MSDNPAADISGVFVTQNVHQGIVKLSGGGGVKLLIRCIFWVGTAGG